MLTRRLGLLIDHRVEKRRRSGNVAEMKIMRENLHDDDEDEHETCFHIYNDRALREEEDK